MPNFRHVITDCIQSGRTGNKVDLHLVEAEKSCDDAAERLIKVQNELKQAENLFNQSSRYLKKLLSDEIAAKIEVPRLRNELGGLKDKLITLTFETDRWQEVCRKQEGQINELLEKKLALSQELSTTQKAAQEAEETHCVLKKECEDLSNGIEIISALQAEIDIFEHIVPCTQPAIEAEKLSSTELINDVNNIGVKIRSALDNKQQADAKSEENSASINTRNKSIEKTQLHITKLEDECSSKNDVIASLDRDITALTKQVYELQQRYQTYYEIIEESNAVTQKRTALINTVNAENTNLKDSLLACNKLEMKLRLEELKMSVFLKETEELNG
nr:hypothetical protein [Desulfobulbaceae bacterium]